MVELSGIDTIICTSLGGLKVSHIWYFLKMIWLMYNDKKKYKSHFINTQGLGCENGLVCLWSVCVGPIGLILDRVKLANKGISIPYLDYFT